MGGPREVSSEDTKESRPHRGRGILGRNDRTLVINGGRRDWTPELYPYPSIYQSAGRQMIGYYSPAKLELFAFREFFGGK